MGKKSLRSFRIIPLVNKYHNKSMHAYRTSSSRRFKIQTKVYCVKWNVFAQLKTKCEEKIMQMANTVDMHILVVSWVEADIWWSHLAFVIVGFGRKCQSIACVFTMLAYTLADTFGVRVLFGLLKSTWYKPNFSLWRNKQKMKILLWVSWKYSYV